ncbi:MAG: hypothetical protein AAGA48_04895 [Myxococcota bacterium]
MLLPQIVLATPAFHGPPDDVARATRAWEAAKVCSGREGYAARDVEIRHRTIPGGFLGIAHTTSDGELVRIDLDKTSGHYREVLVHEVAHAWVSDGPLALVEGAAELLADCIVAQDPGLATLQYDDGRDLTGLPDLRTWAPPDQHEPESLGAIRTDAYIGASRLLRTVAEVLDQSQLWPAEGLSWTNFEAALNAAGPRGQAILAALHGGPVAQREALSDPDLDGVPTLAETLAGTNPHRFDTDGDGWWDGARNVPDDAVAIPLDGTPVCAGHRPVRGQALDVLTGGNLRGADVPRVVGRSSAAGATFKAESRRATGWGHATALVGGGRSVLLQLDHKADHSTGAAWARIRGRDLVADPGCRSNAQLTVWAHHRSVERDVEPFFAALHGARDALVERFGPSPSRIVVLLGGTSSTVKGNVVVLGPHELDRARRTGDWRSLALLAVSVQHLWGRGEPDWTGAEALARSFGAR